MFSFSSLVILIVGMTAGMIAGLFGVGGNFLIVPALSLLPELPISVIVGSGICYVLGPATTAILARRPKANDWALPLILVGGIISGTVIGAELLERAKVVDSMQAEAQWQLSRVIVLGVYFVLLLFIGSFAIWESGQSKKRNGKQQPEPTREKRWWHVEFPDERLGSLFSLSYFGFGVGVLSGLLGISGGVVLFPGLLYLYGFRTRDAVKTTVVTTWLISFQGTIIHAWYENVSLNVVILLLIGGTIGARLGAEIGSRISGKGLRRQFGWLVLATSLLTLYQLSAELM